MFEYEEGTDTTTDTGGTETETGEKPSIALQLRMRKLTDSRNQAREEAKAARAELDALKASAAELPTLKQQIATLTDELDLSRAGLNDPKAIKVARMEYDELPEAERPATLGAYYTGLKDLATTDPTKVPKALTPWIIPPAADPPKREKAPPDTGSDGKLPPTGAVLSVEALRQLRDRAFAPMATQADRDAYKKALDMAGAKK